MPYIELPIPRSRKYETLRKVWTAPTTLLGHAVAKALGCKPAEPIGGEATDAWLYWLPTGKLKGLGAIAIGHVIIADRTFLKERRPWLIAHELSHTRQHDYLGPLYLPAHALFQVLSVLASIGEPRPGYPRQHGHNPLERYFLCVPFDVLAEGRDPEGAFARKVLERFGLESMT